MPSASVSGASPILHGAAEADSGLVDFDGPDDPSNPRNWSLGRKMLNSNLLGNSALVVTFASAVYAPGADAAAKEFGISDVVANLGTSLFLIGYVVGPPVWGPASEFLGRRRPMLVSMFLFALFNVMSAVATNVETLMLGRFLTGFFGSGPWSIVGGGLVDVWDPSQIGPAAMLFALASICGPSLGPMIGAFLIENERLGWRWTSWITMIISFTLFVFLLFFLRESYAPTLLQDKAKRLRYASKNWALHAKLDERRFDLREVLYVYLARPMLMLLREPVMAVLALYVGYTYGILFASFEMIPYVFVTQRGWSPGSAGLVFLAFFVGSWLGAFTIIAFNGRYKRILAERQAQCAPDERCLPMTIGAVLFPLGLLIFAWTAACPRYQFFAPKLTAKQPIYVSSGWPEILGFMLAGWGYFLLFGQSQLILVDCYQSVANSALAGNTMVRSAMAAAFPLFTRAMFVRLGTQWAATLLACLALILLPFPILFRRDCFQLLHNSRYAPQIPRGIPDRAEDDSQPDSEKPMQPPATGVEKTVDV